MNVNQLLAKLDAESLDGTNAPDKRRVLAAEANTLRSALNRKAPAAHIGAVKAEAERVLEMWVSRAPGIDADAQCPEHGCARHRCDADHVMADDTRGRIDELREAQEARCWVVLDHWLAGPGIRYVRIRRVDDRWCVDLSADAEHFGATRVDALAQAAQAVELE